MPALWGRSGGPRPGVEHEGRTARSHTGHYIEPTATLGVCRCRLTGEVATSGQPGQQDPTEDGESLGR